MSDIQERAEADAQRQCDKYKNGDHEVIAKNYVENYNKITMIVNKLNSGKELSDSDLYDYYFCKHMQQFFGLLLCDTMVKGFGYTKDANDLYQKKKKGFFK